MLLRRLELVDFRSYAHAQLEFEPGVTVVVGPNAHGKTNLLEAVYRVASGSSHRAGSDVPLIRQGAETGYVRVEAVTDAGRRRTVELELRAGRNRARVDGREVGRVTDVTGVLRAVLVAPEDLAIARGDPTERRRFLDELVVQRRPALAAVLSDYQRVLRQRNQLLRTAPPGRTPDTLAAWTEQLVHHGSAIMSARIAIVHALSGPAEALYRDLADEAEPVTLSYRSSSGIMLQGRPDGLVPEADEVADALHSALVEAAARERSRGMSLVGPHRDDLDLNVRGLPVRGYASHGQLWSLVLAMRLAGYEVLAEVGDRPVVLLDDVFAELDATRRLRLAVLCERWEQLLVATAIEEEVPLKGAVVDVRLHAGTSGATRREACATQRRVL